MKRAAALAAAVVLAVLGLTACSDYGQGPDGRVVEKDKEGKSRRYLTVETPSGKRVEFRVDSDDFGSCYRGSAYPRCTEVDR